MDQLGAYTWLAIAVIAIVAWSAWERGTLGWIGRVVLMLLAAAASVAAVALLLLGFQMRWTSEGPGILLVMIGLAASVVMALGLWFATIKAFGKRHSYRNRGAAETASEKRRSVVRLWILIAILLVCGVAGGTAWFNAKRAKRAPDAKIAAVHLIVQTDPHEKIPCRNHSPSSMPCRWSR